MRMIPTQSRSYLSLDEVVALCPDVFEEPQDIDCAFILYLLQHAVNYNISSSSANTSARRDKRHQIF